MLGYGHRLAYFLSLADANLTGNSEKEPENSFWGVPAWSECEDALVCLNIPAVLGLFRLGQSSSVFRWASSSI
jgi:hypothetical protein